MTMRKIFNLSEVDLSVPEGSLVSISVAHSVPVRPNALETTALGVLVGKHIDGKVVKPMRVAPYNYETSASWMDPVNDSSSPGKRPISLT